MLTEPAPTTQTEILPSARTFLNEHRVKLVLTSFRFNTECSWKLNHGIIL